MKLIALTLLATLSTVSLAQSVYQQASEQIANGQKQQAWNLLYPLARNDRDAKAMMMLGQMLLNSPEIADSEEKALRMFEAAEREGQRNASAFIEIAKNQQRFSRQAAQRVSKARSYYAEAEREYERTQQLLKGGFIDGDANVYPARVDVFIDGDSALPVEVERLMNSRQALREDVLVYHHLVFDRDQIGNANPFTSDFQPPASGLGPDIDGELARELGVTRLPALVIRTKDSRSPRVVNLSELTAWAKQWRRP